MPAGSSGPAAPGEAPCGSDETEHVPARHDAARSAGEAPTQGRVGNHGEGASEAGDVEGLGRRHQGDASPRDLVVHAGQRQVPALGVEDQVAVDFIGADDQIVAFAESGERAQFLV